MQHVGAGSPTGSQSFILVIQPVQVSQEQNADSLLVSRGDKPTSSPGLVHTEALFSQSRAV